MTVRLTSVLTAGAAIAGLLLPVVLWWADQESKNIELEVVSRVALSPDLHESPSKIAVSIDGRVVENAYIALVEIANAGTQPVVARDYEGPIEIVVSGAKLIQARLVKTSPAHLKPVVRSRGNAVEIAPLLLNSGDRIRISVVTTGSPAFSATARIAGVRSIQIRDDLDSGHVYRAWRNGITAGALLVLYAGMFLAFWTYRQKEMKRWALLAGAFAAVMGSISILSNYEQEAVEVSRWLRVLAAMAVGIPALIGGTLLLKRRRHL